MRTRRWSISIAALAIIGIVVVWVIRARGWVCVDGIIVETQEPYGYCLDWNTATGGLWATIAIVALVAAWFALLRMSGPATLRIVRLAIPAAIVVATIVGVIVNLAVPDYPEGYPG